MSKQDSKRTQTAARWKKTEQFNLTRQIRNQIIVANVFVVWERDTKSGGGIS